MNHDRGEFRQRGRLFPQSTLGGWFTQLLPTGVGAPKPQASSPQWAVQGWGTRGRAENLPPGTCTQGVGHRENPFVQSPRCPEHRTPSVRWTHVVTDFRRTVALSPSSSRVVALPPPKVTTLGGRLSTSTVRGHESGVAPDGPSGCVSPVAPPPPCTMCPRDPDSVGEGGSDLPSWVAGRRRGRTRPSYLPLPSRVTHLPCPSPVPFRGESLWDCSRSGPRLTGSESESRGSGSGRPDLGGARGAGSR